MGQEKAWGEGGGRDPHLKCITQGKGFQRGSIRQSRYRGEAPQVNKRMPCLAVNASEPVPTVRSLTPTKKQPQKSASVTQQEANIAGICATAAS